MKNIKKINNIKKNYYQNKEWWILIAIFLIIFTVKTYYAFQVDYFSDNDAYFTLRQVEHISNNFTPMYMDNLSYGGRTFIFLPLFHYILALFTTAFSPIFIAKVLPNLFATSIIFFTYLLSYELTKDKAISILTSTASVFIPIYFSQTVNSISVYSLVVPLMVLLFYLFIKIENMKNLKLFLLITVLFLLTHPSIILLIISLLVYLVLVKIEDIKLKRSEIEIGLFSAFLMIWAYLLIFKNAFLKHGFSFIWENIPLKYILTYFHQISIWQAIYMIGIIPFVFGIFIIYYYLFNLKDKKVYLLISFAVTTTCLLWLKLIELNLALIFLGVTLVLLFGVAYNHLNQYLKTTRVSRFTTLIFVAVCILFILTSALPSIILTKEMISNSTNTIEIESFKKIKEVTPKNARIATSTNEGHLITYFSERKNFGDTNYLFLEDSNEIIRDIDQLFQTISTIKANEILHKYDIDYVMLTPQTSAQYEINSLGFLDEECFDEIFDNNGIKLYRNKCVIIKSMMIK
jgi:hypothetical protein